MSTTPHSDDGDPTVSMPARADAATPAPPRPGRTRLPSLSILAAIGLFALVAAGAFIVVQRMKPFTTPAAPVPTAAAPQATPQATVPAPPPSPRAPDKSTTPRQMLNDIFERRDRGHTVTARVEGGAVRIRSSSPGYVYVLAASAGQSEGAPLFVAVLFPRAEDTNNRVRAAQTMTLPDLQWPADAEFLAIVSDERREIDVLGSLVGRAICASTSRCSEAYGAVVFSTEGLRTTAGTPAPPISAAPPKAPSVPKAPAVRSTPSVSRRCSDILERASLGETLTDDEQAYLTKDCR
jgi:hypothetical protein